jgi:cysteine protease ATG4
VVWPICYSTVYSVNDLVPSKIGLLIIFRVLSNRCGTSGLRVYITGDGSDVYEDDFMSIAKPDSLTFTPTLVLVGTRLGIEKVTPAYWEALRMSLQMPQSVGIAG